MKMIIKENLEQTFYQQVGYFLKEISPPARIKILLMIGSEEVCVCHLESNLGMKQAYLSQHLMALRKTGILVANREGRFMHYKLANAEMLDLIKNAAAILGLHQTPDQRDYADEDCSCPQCKEKRIGELV